MIIPATPADEAERHSALQRYEILDTDAELHFDDLTHLAATICETPIALMTFIDGRRQWFKSKVGIDVSQGPRETSFCGHGILQRDLFVVTDTLEDSRFADNPFVTNQPNIRFYAGVPLVTADDHALGMLCVTDRVPRHLSIKQLDALRMLGRQAMSQMELRVQLLEQKRGQERLRQTEEQYRQILDAIADMVLCKGPGSRIVWGNKAFRDYYNMTNEQLKNQLDGPNNSPDWTAQYIQDDARVFTTGEVLSIPDEVVGRHDGAVRHFATVKSAVKNLNGKVIMTVGISRDITDSKAMEENLRRAEKLAGIGELAAGVAHELNNPLTSIIGFAQLLLEESSLNGAQRQDLETIHTQSQRCRGIIHNLLQFCRNAPSPSKQSKDLGTIVRETLSLLRYQLSVTSIELEECLAQEPLEVWANTEQLQQVILNLVTNAAQALENVREKRIVVSLRADDQEIIFSVADSGDGIPESIRDKIFDPFFTTKPVGKGTGLGLSICYGIVKDHQGQLVVESDNGKGTTMTVRLPRYLPATPGATVEAPAL